MFFCILYLQYKYLGGEDVKRWLLLSLIVVFIISFSFQTIFADNNDLGWYGYDIYILNNFDVKITSNNIKIEIDEDKLIFSGEYVINNKSDKITEVVLGLPLDNAENLSINDKGNNLKYYKRNKSYMEKNYIYENLPESEKWGTVNLWLKANESRLINIRYDSKVSNDSRGIYKITYNNSSDLYDSKISKTLIIFSNFKPYNILNTSNIEVEKAIYSRDSQLIFEVDDSSEEIEINYELTDNLAVDRLNFSSSKKLKNIANLFRMRDYEAVITLCDEYLADPSDAGLDINQVIFLKAEAFRNIVMFDEYLEIIKNINLNKLYPERLKYKILFDIDEVLNAKIDDPVLLDILNTIQKGALDNNEFLSKWMLYHNKDYISTNQNTQIKKPKESSSDKDSVFGKYISFLKLNNIIDFIKGLKYLYIIIIIVVFFIGFFFGRKSRKKKKNIPYYTFRR